MSSRVPQVLGEVTIGGRGVVNLPAKALRTTGWKAGDKLYVELLGEDVLVLMKRPEDMAEAFAGRFTHLYPDPQDTRRFLAEERASWSRDDGDA